VTVVKYDGTLTEATANSTQYTARGLEARFLGEEFTEELAA
jgi:hypothetical protein